MILEDVGCLVSAVMARPGEKGVPYSRPYMAGEPVWLGFSVFREVEGAQQEVQGRRRMELRNSGKQQICNCVRLPLLSKVCGLVRLQVGPSMALHVVSCLQIRSGLGHTT